jgi:hypothetical protein
VHSAPRARAAPLARANGGGRARRRCLVSMALYAALQQPGDPGSLRYARYLVFSGGVVINGAWLWLSAREGERAKREGGRYVSPRDKVVRVEASPTPPPPAPGPASARRLRARGVAHA